MILASFIPINVLNFPKITGLCGKSIYSVDVDSFFSYSLSKTAVVRAVENLAAELSDHKRITFYF